MHITHNLLAEVREVWHHALVSSFIQGILVLRCQVLKYVLFDQFINLFKQITMIDNFQRLVHTLIGRILIRITQLINLLVLLIHLSFDLHLPLQTAQPRIHSNLHQILFNTIYNLRLLGSMLLTFLWGCDLDLLQLELRSNRMLPCPAEIAKVLQI